jgi:protein SCO1/2
LANTEQSEEKLGIEEHLGETLPLELSFTNSDGKTYKLSELIDKPTIMAFVYYNCPGICSPLLTGLSEVVDKVELNPGEDFQVLTISFDHKENAELAKKWHKNHYSSLKRKDMSPEDWKFMVGDSLSVRKLTDAAGFYYKEDGKDYVHAATLIMVSPKGKITRYLTGTQFLPFDVKMALIEASEGKATPTINKILEYCFSYDPEGNKYVFNFNKIAGTVIFASIGLFFAVLLIKGRKKDKNSNKE